MIYSRKRKKGRNPFNRLLYLQTCIYRVSWNFLTFTWNKLKFIISHSTLRSCREHLSTFFENLFQNSSILKWSITNTGNIVPKDCSLFHKTIEDNPLEGTLWKHMALFTLLLIICSGRMITEGLQKTNFKKTWNYGGFNEIQATSMTSCNIMSPWAKELRTAKSLEDIIWRLHKKACMNLITPVYWRTLMQFAFAFSFDSAMDFLSVENSSFIKPFTLYAGPQLSHQIWICCERL